MQKTAKDRMLYGVIFLLFVSVSFVFFRTTDESDLKGSLMIENEENLNFDQKQSELQQMLAEQGFSNLDCARGVWPTVKCEFDLETTEVDNVDGIKPLVRLAVDQIGFEDTSKNNSLSCFDLNNLNVYQNGDMYHGKVRATCIMNLRDLSK